LNETARVRIAARRRGGCVAARGAGAAVGHAGDRIARRRNVRSRRFPCQRLQRTIVVRASTEIEIEAAFGTLVEQQAGALLVAADVFLHSQIDKLVDLAARHKLPMLCSWRECAPAGGLMSYGANLADGYRWQGVYVGRILKGEKPADLPVQQSVRLDLVINLKTAKALGLEVPPSLLARADEVIE
jgi:ABC-type uncharacterized transport system substrate-binding protein